MRLPRPVLVAILSAAAAFASTPVSVWPVDSLIKVFQDDPTGKNRAADEPWLIARNGHASVQIAIRASAPVSKLKVDVKLAGGLQTQVRRVGYVPVRSNPPGTPGDEVVRAAPARFPDPLFEEMPFALAANQTTAVWITIYAPAGTAPGLYKGEAVVLAGRKTTRESAVPSAGFSRYSAGETDPQGHQLVQLR